MKATSNSTLLIFCLLLLFACNQDDDVANMGEPCEAHNNDRIVDSWSSATYDPHGSCLDGLCISCELVLREDATYQLNYSLFDFNQSPLVVHELQDMGTYSFECLERGTFQNRFTYSYINGVLVLDSATEPTRVLNIRWDGFKGLSIKTDELGLPFYANLLLQE